LKLSIADDEEFPNGNGANGLNKTERRLAKLWKEILGVNEVDKNDNFFLNLEVILFWQYSLSQVLENIFKLKLV